jgi:hypothetical protein
MSSPHLQEARVDLGLIAGVEVPHVLASAALFALLRLEWSVRQGEAGGGVQALSAPARCARKSLVVYLARGLGPMEGEQGSPDGTVESPNHAGSSLVESSSESV